MSWRQLSNLTADERRLFGASVGSTLMPLKRFPVSRVAVAVAMKACGTSPLALALMCVGGLSMAVAAEPQAARSVSSNDGRAEWRTLSREGCDSGAVTPGVSESSTEIDAQGQAVVDGRPDWIGARLDDCIVSPASAVLASLRSAAVTEQRHTEPMRRREDLPEVILPTTLGAPEPSAAAALGAAEAAEPSDKSVPRPTSPPVPVPARDPQPTPTPAPAPVAPAPIPAPIPAPASAQLGVSVREPEPDRPGHRNVESGVGVLRRWLSSLDLEVNPQAWPCLDASALRESVRTQLAELVSAEAAGIALDRESRSRRGNLRWLLDTMAIRNDDPDALVDGVSSDWSVVWLDCGPDGVHLPSLLTPLAEHLTSHASMPIDIDLSALPLPTPKAPPVMPVPLPESPFIVGPDAPDADIDLGSQVSQGESASGDGLFVFDDAIPEGFEALAEPQQVWVDVWFNGRNVGATEITSTPDELIFEAPLEVVSMLEDIEDPESLITLLADPLPTNAHKLCFGRNDPLGCGRVDAEPVAVIYDDNALRVDLFLAPGLQSVQSRGGSRFLEPPERRNSSILTLGAVVSDLEGEESQVDLSARVLASYGKGHISSEIDHTSRTDQTRLRELKLTHFIEGHEVNVGTYGWHPGGAWTNINLLGVGFATSYKTRVDIEQAFSTELLVFLQERAVVQLVVDGRVYAGDSYAPGNQVLDTRALPDGSYPVEIRILEAGGTERSEIRTFTKSTQIPPSGETVFSATAGVPLQYRDQGFAPETSEPPVAGFSVAQRISDQSAGRLGMLQLGERSFLQGDYVFLGKSFSFQLAGSVGEDSTIAANLLASYNTRHGLFSINADHFQSEVDIDVGADDEVLELFPSERTQWTLAATRPVADMTVRASVRHRESIAEGEAATERTEYRLNLRKPLFRSRFLRGFLEAGWQRDHERDIATVQLDVFFDQPDWSARFGTDMRKTGDAPWQAGATANLGYRASRESFDWGADAYARVSSSESAGARLYVEHPLYRATASTDLDFNESGDVTRSSIATATAHVGLDSKGAALGGSEFSQAGVIINVSGEPAGAAYDVIVNGLRKSSGEIGSTQFVGLQPFESYSIKIVPRNVLSNGIGNDVFEFTLYPGTVERIDIAAERQILLIATLVDEQGQSLGNAVVEKEGNPMVTDADGILQAELSPGAVMSVTGIEGQSCVFTVPEAPDGEEVYVPIEPLVCQSTSTLAQTGQ